MTTYTKFSTLRNWRGRQPRIYTWCTGSRSLRIYQSKFIKNMLQKYYQIIILGEIMFWDLILHLKFREFLFYDLKYSGILSYFERVLGILSYISKFMRFSHTFIALVGLSMLLTLLKTMVWIHLFYNMMSFFSTIEYGVE